MTGLENALSATIGSWYLTLGYFGIVLAMAIESCCIPLPSEIVMPLAGFYVAQYPARFNLLGVAFAGAVGCLIGSAAAYAIGRAGGRPLLLRYGRYILISQADSDRADRLFARYGGAVTFFSRLVPVVRTYISLPAGIARMDFVRFCVYTLLGSLPWCLALAWVGTKVGERSRTLGSVFRGLDVVILAALALAIGLYVWRHVRHDRAARTQRAAPARARRPRQLPSSPFETPDRPTVPDLPSVSAWPNKYARPLGSMASQAAQPPVSPAADPTRASGSAPLNLVRETTAAQRSSTAARSTPGGNNRSRRRRR